jgi:hypothetical protein
VFYGRISRRIGRAVFCGKCRHARDLGFRERRVNAAQLRHERSPGTLIKGAPGLSSIIAKPRYGVRVMSG